jgi:glycosyltransferase involved in cell wall biosynthesis
MDRDSQKILPTSKKMRIVILGTRGIPNNYGGFEQCADFLARILVQQGHEVIVYCSHNHPFDKSEYEGVQLVKCHDPEDKIGTAGQFIYDLNCILDSRRQKVDILLQLGYTSSSIWNFLIKKNQILVTNMDGLEFKRSKYNSLTKLFLRFAERLAVFHSDHLVADSKGISKYLLEKYKKDSTFIAYGAEIPSIDYSNSIIPLGLQTRSYDLVIARLEPENNIEMIIQGWMLSDKKRSLIIVGNHKTKFGEFLKSKYNHSDLNFVGAIYDFEALNILRHHSYLYFHGHSVGGTNPSLLEAMASSTLICAHNNAFNNAVLEENGFRFSNSTEVSHLINSIARENNKAQIENNLGLIKNLYSWQSISSKYEELFCSLFIDAEQQS